MNPKSVPFDGAQDVLREPQRERSESHWIQNHKTISVRPEEPPSFGGVSKGCLGEDRQSLGTEGAGAVLRLLVRNHPGVMSHVCGLFARRGFNVEGILCVPIADGMRSVILLVVNEDERLEQLIRQLRKLEDVLDIQRAPEAREVFAAVAGWLC